MSQRGVTISNVIHRFQHLQWLLLGTLTISAMSTAANASSTDRTAVGTSVCSIPTETRRYVFRQCCRCTYKTRYYMPPLSSREHPHTQPCGNRYCDHPYGPDEPASCRCVFGFAFARYRRKCWACGCIMKAKLSIGLAVVHGVCYQCGKKPGVEDVISNAETVYF